MKIAFFELEPWEEEVLRHAFPKDKLFFSTKKLCHSDFKKVSDYDIITTFVNCKINKKVIDSLPNLKFIATMSTGYDHIDLEICSQKNIKVSNVPFYGENTVAEHTFALILGLSRKLVNNVDFIREKKYYFGGFRGFDLRGKTIGVVGGGSIGQHVVRIAKGFEMNVLVFDLKQDKKLAKKIGFKYVSLDNLLKNSDIVSLHVPYNKHTHHLIDKKSFSIMKEGAYLINTSRGGIVETDALLQALRSKKLAGAGLDVLEDEGLMGRKKLRRDIKEADFKLITENKKLLKMGNVLITPHCAFNTQEAITRILDTTIDNINSFKKGKVKNEVKFG
ncbi:MAG: NAD(P)-dependent oxidoreductase [Candidatus Woesearchaeota archaeon]